MQYIRRREELAFKAGAEAERERAKQMARRAEEIKALIYNNQMRGILMAQKRDRDAALQAAFAGVSGASGVDGDCDLVRDVQWVYQNLGGLFMTSLSGARVLNPEIIKLAPSPGAVAFADFACQNQGEFFSRFLSVLFKESIAQNLRQSYLRPGTIADKTSEMDSGLRDLEEFLKDS